LENNNQILDIKDLAQELGMMHITIMQLRAENEALKKQIEVLESEE